MILMVFPQSTALKESDTVHNDERLYAQRAAGYN